MSTPASSPELNEVAALVDPRLREQFVNDVEEHDGAVPLDGHVVLVGHRAAGKTRLLGPLSRWAKRMAFDLDAVIEVRTGKPLRELFERSQKAFRTAERDAFESIDGKAMVSAGGGFLSHHADLLKGHTPVLVPVSAETFRDRLKADVSRPRLEPALSVDEELDQVWAERERLHAQVRTVPLAGLVATLLRGAR